MVNERRSCERFTAFFQDNVYTGADTANRRITNCGRKAVY